MTCLRKVILTRVNLVGSDLFINKKQKFILIIILSFLFLFILTSLISYHESTTYHQINSDYYVAIKTRQIQPFYDISSLWIWLIGINISTLFTYLYFRKYDDDISKRILVDYKLLIKTTIIYIAVLYSIGIFGEFYPSLYIGQEEMYLISKTEFEEKIKTNDSGFNEFDKEYWIEI